MPPKGPPQRHGLKLPAALNEELGLKTREEIEASGRGGPNAPRPRGRGGGVLGRKEARKAAREAKKQHRRPVPQQQRQPQHQKPIVNKQPSANPQAEGSHVPKRLQGLSVIGKGLKVPPPAPPKPKAAPQPPPPSKESSKRKHRSSLPPSSDESEEEEPQPKPQKKARVAKEEPKPTKRHPEEPIPQTNDQTSAPPQKSKKITKDTKTPLQRLLEKSGGDKAFAPEDTTSSRPAHARPKTKAEQDEEDEITWLEYNLGKGRGKEDEDGLDDLLDDLDRFYPGMYDQGSNDGGNEGAEDNSPGSEGEGEGEASDADSFYGFGSEGDDDPESPEESIASHSAESASEDKDENGDSSALSKAENDESTQPEAASSKAKVPEPPPAAPASASTGGKYVPPALRRLQAAQEAQNSIAPPASAYDDPAHFNLRRQLKGQLNRLGEGNLDGTLTTMETIFSQNSRAVVTQILTRLLLDAVIYVARATDQFIVLHATFISALHRTVGIEFGASFIADLVDALVGAFDAAQDAHTSAVKQMKEGHGVVPTAQDGALEGGEGMEDVAPETLQAVDPLQEANSKKTINLVSLLSELYNLQTVSSLLIYDLVRRFAEPAPDAFGGGLSELSVEVLLRIVRLCGSQLRSDDPSSLRDIVDFIQERAVPAQESKTTGGVAIPQQPGPAVQLSSRSKFMLERLAELRSGKPQRQAAGTSDTLSRMKKYIGGLGKKRALRTFDALRVTLKDLQDADRKGRWWLVGAAWTGHDGQEAEGVTAARPLTNRKQQDDDLDDEEAKKHNALVAYARAHGLGTAVRQNIFITIMTSSDFVEATSRLQSMRLNEVQRREIVRVLVRCVQIDRTYNPYFALIGFHLAGPHVGDPARAVRFTMQYVLWDFMRATLGQAGVAGKSRAEAELDEDALDGDDEVDEKRIANVARAYAWWIAKGALTLNVLKTIDFVSLKPKARFFVQHLLVNTVLSTQTRSPSLAASTLASPDRALLEQVVVQGTVGNLELTRGLLVFTKTHLNSREQKKIAGESEAISDRLQWALGVVRETLQVGASLGGT